ncbi:uncharacterized protein [Cicer arietinum]|uniref:Uncharacterized protein LOC101514665 n=1 Tax=Cicer arietinum TaxID=3827 RepID=A0A1S2Z473_CICAR|nr:uncharacterized protein LOC101514665 [Cicer arietinum]
MDPRARKCLFLGFKLGTKGYVLFDLNTRDIFTSRNVIFYEHIFPYPSIDSINVHCIPNDVTDFTTLLFDDPIYIVDDIGHVSNILPNSHFDNHTFIITDSTNSPAPTLRRSSRPRQKPAYLQDFQCNIVVVDSSFKALYPISSILSYNNLSPTHFSLVSAISFVQEPHTYKHAIKHPFWIQAMDSEIQALTQNNTWILTPLPHDISSPHCRFGPFTSLKPTNSIIGHFKYFLGLEVARSKAGLHISQHKYTLDILHEVGLWASKPAFVPT